MAAYGAYGGGGDVMASSSGAYDAPSGRPLRVSPSEEWRMRSADEAELRVHPPNIEIDNMAAEETLITVECANRSGILLEMVTTLTEMDLLIRRATISSDGGWFVDAFYVTTADGGKVHDEEKLERIRQMLSHHGKDSPAISLQEHRMQTLVELSGQDRPGLLSDVSAVVAQLGCNVITAAVWTQRTRVALLLCVEAAGGGPVRDPSQLTAIQEHLASILGEECVATTCVDLNLDGLRAERRLHTLMLGNEARREQRRRGRGSALTALDEGPDGSNALGAGGRTASRAAQLAASVGAATQALQAASAQASGISPQGAPPAADAAAVGPSPPASPAGPVGTAGPAGPPTPARPSSASSAAATASGPPTPRMDPEGFAFEVFNCPSTGYAVLRMRCRDRPKLLFDTVCTLADLDFDIFHAAIESGGGMASQEYYVLHKNGQPIDGAAERAALRGHLADAVQRRAVASTGHRLQVVGGDRPGLLSSLCRVLREGGLTITKAEVETVGDQAVDTFFLTDASGSRASRDTLRQIVGKMDDLAEGINVSCDSLDPGDSDGGTGAGDGPFSLSLLRNRLATWMNPGGAAAVQAATAGGRGKA